MDKKQPNVQTGTQLTFKIANFEGPLDLLLHLIKKNEMDIYDIPMTTITSQYIDYLHHMKKMELDLAGEYFVTAAMLLNIKSRMLLPSQATTADEENDEVGEFEEDPRDQLVQQLLAHQLYQQAAAQLQGKFEERTQHFEREQALIPSEAQLGQLTTSELNISQLEQAFKKVLVRRQKRTPLRRSITNDKYSIKDEMVRLHEFLLRAQQPVIFADLFTADFELELYVTTFLALLELVKKGSATVLQVDNFGEIKMISSDKNVIKPSKN